MFIVITVSTARGFGRQRELAAAQKEGLRSQHNAEVLGEVSDKTRGLRIVHYCHWASGRNSSLYTSEKGV